MKIKDDEIYFAKIRQSAVVPSKKTEDAGYDVYADFEGDFFVIEPGASRGIPSGIACAFSPKFYAQVEERSSMAKIGIKKSGGVMDSGYRGEYIIVTYNTNKIPFIISKIKADDLSEVFEVDGKKYNKNEVIIYPSSKAICQIVLHEIPVLDSKEISYDELCSIESLRGKGGFGSSGK